MNRELSEKIAAIRLCRPRLAEDITAILTDPENSGVPLQDFTFQTSRRGEMTLLVGNRYVHSGVAPLREARKRVHQRRTTGRDGVVTVGIGLGYLNEAVHGAGETPGPVLSITFSAPLVTESLLKKPSSWWCTVGPDRIVPAWLPDVLPAVLREERISDPLVLSLDAFAHHCADEYNRIMSVLRNTDERNTVNRNTLRRFGRLWVRNSIRNIALGKSWGGIDHLENTFQDIPALVCGAGPSLDDLRPFVAELARRSIVIAVDTAVPVLNRWGIEPHFAVVSDPQYWNSRHFDRSRPTSAVLVAEPATHPRSIRLWQGAVVFSASLFPLGEYFDRFFHRNLKLGAGGSVATSAWDLARILGSRDIAMAGVDLGFPGNQTHCSDSFFENLLRREAHRLSPAEHGMARYLHGASPGPVGSVSGRPVLSDRRMDIYRSWFAEQSRRFPDVSTVLLSPDSSAIEGVLYESPEERTTRLVESVPGKTGLPIRQRPSHTTNTANTSKTVLKDLLKMLGTIEETLCSGVETCRRLKESKYPDVRFLDKIDGALSSSASKNVVGFLATEALEVEMRKKPNTIAESIDQSERIYMALAESCRFHADLIQRFL